MRNRPRTVVTMATLLPKSCRCSRNQRTMPFITRVRVTSPKVCNITVSEMTPVPIARFAHIGMPMRVAPALCAQRSDRHHFERALHAVLLGHGNIGAGCQRVPLELEERLVVGIVGFVVIETPAFSDMAQTSGLRLAAPEARHFATVLD